MSAPSRNGRCTSGVQYVLSTATSAPRSCAPALSAGRSATSIFGFVGDSTHSSAAPVHASSTASVSVMSTSRGSHRPGAASSISARVPVYPSTGSTTGAPTGNVSSTAATAAIPDANASARPSSSAPIASSNASHVGFPSRPYATGPPAWYVEENTTGGFSGPSGTSAGRPAVTASVAGESGRRAWGRPSDVMSR